MQLAMKYVFFSDGYVNLEPEDSSGNST